MSTSVPRIFPPDRFIAFPLNQGSQSIITFGGRLFSLRIRPQRRPIRNMIHQTRLHEIDILLVLRPEDSNIGNHLRAQLRLVLDEEVGQGRAIGRTCSMLESSRFLNLLLAVASHNRFHLILCSTLHSPTQMLELTRQSLSLIRIHPDPNTRPLPQLPPHIPQHPRNDLTRNLIPDPQHQKTPYIPHTGVIADPVASEDIGQGA